jgi:hypothetical protein
MFYTALESLKKNKSLLDEDLFWVCTILNS